MTKKYNSKDSHKTDLFHDDTADSFYDVSFDLPMNEEEDDAHRHSSPEKESVLTDSAKPSKSSKWDGFYDDFRQKQDANFEQAKQEQEAFEENFRQQQLEENSFSEAPLPVDLKDDGRTLQEDAAKSSVMLDRSIRKVRSLFTDFDNYEAPVSNPYKDDEVSDSLKQRAALFSKQESPATSEKAKDTNDSQPKWFSRFRRQATEHQTALPSHLSYENLKDDELAETEQAEAENARSVTGVDLFKNMFTPKDDLATQGPSEAKQLANEKLFEEQESLNNVITEPASETATGNFRVDDELVNPTDDHTQATDKKHSSWYQKFSPFKDKHETDLKDAPDAYSEGQQVMSHQDGVNSNEDSASISTNKEVEVNQPLLNSHAKAVTHLDKDYFDTDITTDETDDSFSRELTPELASKRFDVDQLAAAESLPSSIDTHSYRPASANRRYSSDLPSPEEIRRERERRRRLRVQELEQMTSSEEVEQTYKQSYTDWLKAFNKKTVEKDMVVPNHDTSLTTSSIPLPTEAITEEPTQLESQIFETGSLTEVFDEPIKPVASHEQIEHEEVIEQETPTVEGLADNDAEETIAEIPEDTVIEAVGLSTQSELIASIDDLEADLQTEEALSIPSLYDNARETDLVVTDTSLTEDDWSESLTSVSEEQAVDEVVTIEDNSEDLLTEDHFEESEPIAEVQATTLDLTDTLIEATDSDVTHFTVLHEPVDETEPQTQATIDNEETQLPEEISIYKRKDKAIKKEIYSLDGLSKRERVFFGINIAFNVIKRIGLYVILLGILGGALAGGAGFGYFANLVSKTPPPTADEMAAAINRLEQQSTIYYASGDPIANVRADVVRTVTSIDEISPYITDGLIATEDEDFYTHPGVMPKAIFRAVIESILTSDGSGGSTLTQQLVKQQLLSSDVTFFRKANEILLALRLENYFTKDQILMAYLNVSPFGRNNNGDNVAGIMKASEGIFGVKPSDVTLNQAAFLVGLPQDPYNYTPYNQTGALVDDFSAGVERMHEVLYRMYREEKISKEDYDTALTYDITKDFLPQETRDEQRQSYLYQAMMNGAIEQLMLLNIKEDGYDWKTIYADVDWYNEYYFAAADQLRTGGYKVFTTIDKEIYDHLQVSAAAYDDYLGATYDGIYVDPETGAETYYIESVQKGLVVIDNTTGKVLGFVSGTDFENNQIDHAFGMHRSPGSTIKPIAVYGPAIQENLITPATIIPDTAFVYTDAAGDEYRPTNYGEVVSGTYYSARTALMKSDNIPTVRIYEQLLNRKVPIIDYLEKMGFNTVDSYTEEDTQYLPFALGGVFAGPTVFEQTRAFSTFANNGQYVDGYYIERIEDAFGNVVFQQNDQPVQVFSEDSNYLMVDMLRDTMNGGSGQTAGGVKNFGGDWISKSGISENSKDIWFIGSTPSITIGSWIGYDNQFAEYVFDLNDGFDREAVRSQTYWGNIVNDLYAFRPDIFGVDRVFTQPDTVQSQSVLQTTGTLPGTLQINNRNYQVTAPVYNDLFKTSHPAPALNYNFMFNATDADHQSFWAQFAQAADQLRQQQEQQSSSSSSSEESESSADETSETPPAEETPQETPPAE